jgi:tetratricopeptide (TPR) repeat protein
VHAELIFRRGTPPDCTYTFKHALVQDAAYGTLLRSRRQQIHARIATTLETRFQEIAAAQPGLMGWHCAEGGLTAKAIEYFLRAGRLCLARSTMMEAVAPLRLALSLIGRLPDSTGRAQQELEMHLVLGSALMATRGVAAPEIGEHFGRARALCKRLGLPPLLANLGLFQHHLLRSELALASGYVEEQFELAQIQHDFVAEWTALVERAVTHFWLGDFVGPRRDLDRVLERFDRELHSIEAPQQAFDPLTLHLVYSFLSLLCLGYFDQARARRDEALSRARRLMHANTLALALEYAFAADAYAGVGPALLLPQAEELAAVSEEHGFAHSAASAAMYRGWCLSMLGRTEEGLALFLKGMASYRATGARLTLPLRLTMLAEAYGQAGQADEALRRLDEAAGLVEATQERCGEANMHRVRGELLTAIGDTAAAESSFGGAITVARRQSAKLWEVRAATSLARLWRDQGRHAEARDLLAAVYGWFTEGFDTPVLKEAKILLDELSGQAYVATSRNTAAGIQ